MFQGSNLIGEGQIKDWVGVMLSVCLRVRVVLVRVGHPDMIGLPGFPGL